MKYLARPLHRVCQSTFTNMKYKSTLLVLLATGLAVTIFAALGNVVFPEARLLDKLMAVFYSVAFLLFAVRDYSRRPKSIALKSAPLLRPEIRIALDARKSKAVARPNHRSACTESSAA